MSPTYPGAQVHVHPGPGVPQFSQGGQEIGEVGAVVVAQGSGHGSTEHGAGNIFTLCITRSSGDIGCDIMLCV